MEHLEGNFTPVLYIQDARFLKLNMFSKEYVEHKTYVCPPYAALPASHYFFPGSNFSLALFLLPLITFSLP